MVISCPTGAPGDRTKPKEFVAQIAFPRFPGTSVCVPREGKTEVFWKIQEIACGLCIFLPNEISWDFEESQGIAYRIYIYTPNAISFIFLPFQGIAYRVYIHDMRFPEMVRKWRKSHLACIYIYDMRSPGIPRNLKKSHSAGKYTVHTRFPGFSRKPQFFPREERKPTFPEIAEMQFGQRIP